ncbi:putative equilibrative nucleoside transporter [Ixodes scapularis]
MSECPGAPVAECVDMLDPVESKTGKYGVLSLRTPPASPSSVGGGADSAFESSDVLDRCLDVAEDVEPDVDEEDVSRSLWDSRRPHSLSAARGGGAAVGSDAVRNRSGAGADDDPAGSGVRHGVNFRVQDVVVRMRSRAYGRPSRAWSGVRRGVMARVQVARTVWPYMLSIALAYFVTLSLFPGIESEIVSCRLGSWMPVLLMALFNAADFFGKVLASIRYDWSRSQLVWMSSCRVVLVPLMALCAVPSRDPVQNASVAADVWAMVLSVLLGITNGVFGSVPMIVAPSRVPDDQKELTGNIMTLSYSVGLTTGSGVAYLIEYLIGWTHVTSVCTADVVEATVTWSNLNETLSNFSTTALAFVTSLLPKDNVTALPMSP